METFSTKVAVVVRNDLQAWQKLNVCAFLMSGIVASAPDMVGQAYVDAAGNSHLPLSRQPIVILGADGATLSAIHKRALERNASVALYVAPMFSTGHDEANRAVFAQYGPDNADIVGLALREERKLADKILKGAKLHT